MSKTISYGLTRQIDLGYEETVEATREALGEEGFGVLTEIDVAATLKKKLEVDFRRYIILGACNPSLAHRALEAERDIGLLLPCNVIVYENDGGGCTVAALDPGPMVEMTDNPGVEPVASEARERLGRALDSLQRRASA